MAEFGLHSLSSSQVSRATKLLDHELEALRSRALGEVRYLMLDARYASPGDGHAVRVHHGGVVRDCAMLSAIGVGPDERRRVLGVSVALLEAEVHWRRASRPCYARLGEPRGPRFTRCSVRRFR